MRALQSLSWLDAQKLRRMRTLVQTGITKAEWHYRYLIGAGLIAATGLIVVYSSLFWLRATSKVAAQHVQGGG